MPETVIVTIRWNGVEIDFELPALKPFAVWAEPLKLALKNNFYGMCLDRTDPVLLWNGTRIPKDAILSECGIFDGAILELQLR